MVDKIKKFLKKRDKKAAKMISEITDKICKGDLEGFDIRKIKTKKNEKFYRLRKGRVRIIFQEIKGKFIVKMITYRDDQTYSDF